MPVSISRQLSLPTRRRKSLIISSRPPPRSRNSSPEAVRTFLPNLLCRRNPRPRLRLRGVARVPVAKWRMLRSLTTVMREDELWQLFIRNHQWSVYNITDVFYVPDLRREAHYEMTSGVCLSVCLSVCPSHACLDQTREQKGLGSPNLARWKPITRVIHESVRRSECQWSRSRGQLMLSRQCIIRTSGEFPWRTSEYSIK